MRTREGCEFELLKSDFVTRVKLTLTHEVVNESEDMTYELTRLDSQALVLSFKFSGDTRFMQPLT